MSFKITDNCFSCGKELQRGPHSNYEGHVIHRYQFTVCDLCYKNNEDGWVSQLKKRITDHLNKEGVEIPSLNEKGFLPRD